VILFTLKKPEHPVFEDEQFLYGAETDSPVHPVSAIFLL
jgi:hypothetical protein